LSLRQETDLTPAEVEARLSHYTAPLAFLIWGVRGDTPLVGEVLRDCFRVWRRIGYINFFLPVAYGRFRATP